MQFKVVLGSFILILVFLTTSPAQVSTINQEGVRIQFANPSLCEDNSAVIDNFRSEAYNTKERVFVIARAGLQETELTNLKRLHFLKRFLQRDKGFESLDVIYARGEKVNEQGKLEFYIGGKLRLMMFAQKDRTPCLGCCEDATVFPQQLTSKLKTSGNSRTKLNKKSKIRGK